MDIKNIIIGIAIIVLTISVAVYGISTFYDRPSYEDFCGNYFNYDTKEECLALGGLWTGPNINTSEGVEQLSPGKGNSYCSIYEGCRQDYEKASENYSKIVFMISVLLGILVIIFGAIVFGLETVGAGLMGGGVGIILYGVGAFWRFAQDWFKFLISLIGLSVLIWFAHWFNTRIDKKKKRR